MNTSTKEVSIHISCSSMSTEVNKTGSWRFVRPKYDEKTAPCSAACPAGENIARIEMLAGQGLFKEAVQTILMENPFPSVCGRVCFHPCETNCNRAKLDEPISIHRLERYLGDRVLGEDITPALPICSDNGKKVLIAGAGPSGLAAGYFLAHLGYVCDVFEAKTEPGGILRWGIPSYRLPTDVLKHEVDRVKRCGVKIHCNTPVTKLLLQQIQNRYDAVFIACGYGRDLQMGIPGQALATDGLEFLRTLRQNKSVALHGPAAVIGGGNTAVDVARSLVRLGAETMLVYRRRKQDMPAFGHEVAMAEAEGVQIVELSVPIRIEPDGRNLCLTLQPMKISGMEDASGRARVIPDGDASRSLRVESIFTAIGAEVEEPWQMPPGEDAETMALSHCVFTIKEIPVLFGGDLTNPDKSVTDAIASGKEAAMALNTFFEGGWETIQKQLARCRVGNGPALSMARYLNPEGSFRNPAVVEFEQINLDYFTSASGVSAPILAADKRLRSFEEVEETLSEFQTLQETGRCFNCGLCNACDNCRRFCPELAVTIKDGQRQVNLDYCKGCGICVVECPRDAMALEEEI
jgi:NADPH-dependent glutamate synthase beta subunit-like oxidoreductase/ferredoxin